MELRETFNEDAVSYDRYRPNYPPELFRDIFAYSDVGRDSSLVEIGVGTGKATTPFLEAGCQVRGVELGDKLSAFAAEKFRAYENFAIHCGDFMEFPLEDASVDLVYSATAFHWLPQEAAYGKIRSCLKPGGTLAIFRIHAFPNRMNDPTNAANRQVYDRLRPNDRRIVEFSEDDCAPTLKALRAQGFRDVEARLYRRVRPLLTEAYIGLLGPYSGRAVPEPGLKRRFEEEMRDAIDAAGGFINIYDTVALYLARNP